MQALQSAALSPATLKYYHKAWNKLVSFSKSLDLDCSIPTKPYILKLFIADLVNKKTPPNSIQSIFSAIGYFHKIRDESDPTKLYSVKQVLQGAHKCMSLTTVLKEKRLPIDIKILNDLIKVMQHQEALYKLYESCLFSAMFSFAFFFSG